MARSSRRLQGRPRLTDRLFLTELAREIAPAVVGRAVRSFQADPTEPALVSVVLGPGKPRRLVFHLGRGAPGLYLGDARTRERKPSPREAKLTKWLASARVSSIFASELDRVVTMELEQVRLSGRKKAIAFVLEVLATRAGLYIVDRVTDRVVDSFTFGGCRVDSGERFVALEPPPHAAVRARDLEEFERRLEERGGSGRASLLYATGWTPLLVREMEFLGEIEGRPVGSAFELLHERLEHPRPVLYTSSRTPAVLLSPVLLGVERGKDARPMPTFNDAMEEAIRISFAAERELRSRQRLQSAISRRRDKLRGLHAKLRKQRETLADPKELRRRGEIILAGLAQVERLGDGVIRLPDPFDPAGDAVEITVDPRFDLAANAERLFRRARKVRRTRVELEKRLDELERDLSHVEGAVLDLADAVSLEELEDLEREAEEQGLVAAKRAPARSSRRARRLPPRRFSTPGAHVVLVGRSARSNEEVTFELAKPDDLWLHASGVPGSHVVLKRTSAAEPEEEDVLRAAALAARFSKARHDKYVDVRLTERRNVSRVKGAPTGFVKVEKSRTVRVKPADDVDIR